MTKEQFDELPCFAKIYLIADAKPDRLIIVIGKKDSSASRDSNKGRGILVPLGEAGAGDPAFLKASEVRRSCLEDMFTTMEEAYRVAGERMGF